MSDEDIDYPNAYDGWRRGGYRAPAAVGEAFSRAKREPEPVLPELAGDKVCRICQATVTILHAYPGDSRRSVCAACQGRANRKVCDRMGEAVKAIKAAMETRDRDGKPGRNERAEEFLKANGYEDTVEYFAKKRKEQESATSGRGGFE
jgi:hypothetical protein